MRSRDTSQRAAVVQAQLQEALGPEGRLSLAMKASDFAREFAIAAVRERYPEFTKDQISRELVRQLYGHPWISVK